MPEQLKPPTGTEGLRATSEGNEQLKTNFVLYRSNYIFDKVVGPLVSEKGIASHVFEERMDEDGIAQWIKENAGLLSQHRIIADITAKRASGEMGKDWIELDRAFRDSAGEEISDIVRKMLAVEKPTKVSVIGEHMGDHDVFNTGRRNRDEYEEAAALVEVLRNVVDVPPTFLHIMLDYGTEPVIDNGFPINEDDIVWVFADRHYLTADNSKRAEIIKDKGWRLFRLPIENLIADAAAFGADVNEAEYRDTVRKKLDNLFAE